MFAKPVTQAFAGFPYATFITFTVLDEVYLVSRSTCVSTTNANVSIRRVKIEDALV